MLVECLRYVTTPCPRYVRSLGYLRQLIGLESRHRRCRQAWSAHLDSCKSLIFEAAAQTRGGRILVLGSGLLLDIPLARLAEQAKEVVLADLVHLSPVRRFASRFANVSLTEIDVTGVARAVFELGAAHEGGELPRCRPSYFLDEGFDLVVSANLLSQLPLVPLEYLEGLARPFESEALEEFARSLVLNHLEWLRSFRARVCLITDIERLTYDGDTLVDREDALWGAGTGLSGREWTWRIAPQGEADRRYELRHRVLGTTDLGPGPQLRAGDSPVP